LTQVVLGTEFGFGVEAHDGIDGGTAAPCARRLDRGTFKVE
jgi:hypothetical protein